MRTATIYNFLLEANLMAAIAILLMIPIRKFLRKPLGSRVLCFGWLLVALRLLCPLALPNPFISTIRSDFALDTAIRPIAGQLRVRFSDLVNEAWNLSLTRAGGGRAASGVLRSMDQGLQDGTLSRTLLWVYLTGIAAVVLWDVAANIRFRLKMRAAIIEPVTGKLREQYEALCRARKVRPVPVYFADPLPSACLVGVFRPYIVLPLTAKPNEAIQVLTHEVCHLKGGDNLWGLVRLVCCAVHWFDPLVWAAARMSRTDSELACDDRVVARLAEDDRLAYANVLVLAASRHNAPGPAVLATGMTMTGRRLKTRVEAILRGGRVLKGLAIAFVLLSSMALLGAFATAEYIPAPTLPVSAGTSATFHHKPLSNVNDAIVYAKALWQNPYVAWDTAGLSWQAEALDEDGVRTYQVVATEPKTENTLIANFSESGEVLWLSNSLSGEPGAFSTIDYVTADSAERTKLNDAIGMWLLDAADALNGNSYTIEAFDFEGERFLNGRRFCTFAGLVYADDGTLTLTRFKVQIEPSYCLVGYEPGWGTYADPNNG